MLIKLTTTENSEVWINPHYIVSMEATSEGTFIKSAEPTQERFRTIGWSVKEKPDEIMGLINEGASPSRSVHN